MGPKKGKKKKPLFGEADQEEEEARKKAEEERLEQERIRREMEKELKRMKKQKAKEAAKEKREDEIRTNILTANCSFFSDFLFSRNNKAIIDRKNVEWDQYSSCNVQPFPYDPPSLNTYIYAFHKSKETENFLKVNSECEKLIEIMRRVDKYIDEPMDLHERTVKNLEEVKERICNELIYKYDAATFQAIMNLEEYFSKVDVWKVEALNRSENFLLWIWGWAVGGNVERKKKKVFKDTMPRRSIEDLDVRLPRRFKYKRLHLRVIRVSYDLFSWKCSTYSHPQAVDNHDLYQETLNIREREINALLEHSTDLDHECMPWWYLDVYPVPIKEEKPKNIKSLTKHEVPKAVEVEEEACEEEEEEETLYDASLLSPSEQIFIFDDQYSSKKILGQCSEEIKAVPILYSFEMHHLRKGKQVFQGPVYYDEPEFIDFLADKSETVSVVSSDSDIICHQADSDSMSDQDNNSGQELDIVDSYLDFISKAKRKNQPELSKSKVRRTSKRFFLDYRPFNPQRSASEIEEKLFDIIFRGGKTGLDIVEEILSGERKEISDKKIRTMRDFMRETIIKDLITPSVSENAQGSTRKSKRSFKTKLNLTKITTPEEMRAFDEEVQSILKMTKNRHSEYYVSELVTEVEESVLNLRQYSIIGGVYLIDFVQDEPQAVVDDNNMKTQLHYGDYWIKKEPFYAVPVVHFDAALAAERQLTAARGSRQSAVRNSTKQKQTNAPAVKEGVELEDDETIHVQLKIYEKAAWFNAPMPVIWDEEKKNWTKKNLYDAEIKFNEGKLFFKLGKTSVPLALASYRWHNLPYSKFHLIPGENWETKPTVLFNLSGKLVTLYFLIEEHFITLKNIERTSLGPFQHMIGRPMIIGDMINGLRKCNLDIFPEWDTFLYVNASLKKSRPLEDHLYKCLAFISSAYEVRESQWNNVADYNTIYIRMKPSVNNDPIDFDCLLASPLRSYYVKDECVDLSIPTEPLYPTLGFQPDLKSLVESSASSNIRSRIRSVPSGLVENVYSIIQSTKILSFT